jgi:hypothetical protein
MGIGFNNTKGCMQDNFTEISRHFHRTMDGQSTFYSNGQARTLQELHSFKLLRAKEPCSPESRSADVLNSEVSVY